MRMDVAIDEKRGLLPLQSVAVVHVYVGDVWAAIVVATRT